MKNLRERKEALELLIHPRGHFLISEALFFALKFLMAQPEEEQPLSDMADLMLLGLELFPTFFLKIDSGQEESVIEAA